MYSKTGKCSECIRKEILQVLAVIVFVFGGLFWTLPKFIYRKAGKKGVIIYFASLVVLGLGIYINASIKEGQREEAREAAKGVAEGVVPTDITDSRDDRKYRIVKLGNQVWMAENLKYNAEGSKCYDDKPGNCKQYGRLYNWETAMKACPSGWHLPSEKEWQALVDFAGGRHVAGEKLKAKNYKGTDEFGFSALPGGTGNSTGFRYVDAIGYWWSSVEGNSNKAYSRSMFYHDKHTHWEGNSKSHLFSVRCVQD